MKREDALRIELPHARGSEERRESQLKRVLAELHQWVMQPPTVAHGKQLTATCCAPDDGW